jgi:hypothetical protein
VCLKLGVDALPVIKGKKSWTQVNVAVLGGNKHEDDTNTESDSESPSAPMASEKAAVRHVHPLDLAFVAGLSMHPEGHAASIAMVQEIGRQIEQMEPFDYKGYRLDKPMPVTTVDWSTREKLGNEFGAGSDFVGAMFPHLQRAQWKERLLGTNPLLLEPISWQDKIRFGQESQEKLNTYMSKFKATCEPPCAACKANSKKIHECVLSGRVFEPDECKVVAEEKKKYLKAHCLLAGHAQKGPPSILARFMPHCVLHAPQRMAPKDAVALIKLSPAIGQHMMADAMLHDFAESLVNHVRESPDACPSVNVCGAQAAHFYTNCINCGSPLNVSSCAD